MTTKNTEERIALLKSITLSESSRTRMREELSSYSDLHSVTTAAAPQAAISPFFSYFSAGFFRITAAMVVLVSMLGGTAYAASDAKPGTTLYPVKLNLTEPVQTALIPSVEGKAAWHAILAERRLEEATDLAVAGTLDPNTQVAITDNFTKHVQESSAAATQLQQEGNISAALSVRSDLEARITAHEDILSQVVTHLADVASTTDDTAATISVSATKDLLAVVHDSQTAVAGERLALEDSVAQSEASTTPATTVTVAGTEGANTDVAIATAEPAHMPTARIRAKMLGATTSTNSTDSSRAIRNTEINAILFKNSALLKSLGILATTTATTSSSTPDGSGSTDTIDTVEVPQNGAANTTQNTESEINLKKY